MKNEMDREQLKQALSQLSAEDQKDLMSEVSPEVEHEPSPIVSSNDQNEDSASSQKVRSYSDLSAKLSLESEKISVRHVLSCIPWVMIGLGILVGLTVALKFGWNRLMSR